ncbi:DUF421 domain-containing protein [Pseudoroseicyclus tamaricis]|uniref:DUF421 domain-containing protein n=1 Tax=Pseudoroseicyclus tamaricis TaxID=2705421 RepID=A0A6B2K1B2_9RHOB|nr:YetF domain-containing protein [Pseudoroseicyclus tamaricis]NDV02234.1 DUF421 domain-containing protein [Pseudoroseicyclus tamaricis]
METFVQVLARGLVTVALVVALTRLNGLRSFSKISAFDFAITVATGSVLATALTTKDAFGPALAALVVLFLVQGLVSRVRVRLSPFRNAVDNTPLLLMENGSFMDENMESAQIARSDLIAKLRESGTVERAKIRAVVLETTGTVSVIYADPGAELAEGLMDGVRRTPRALP